MEPETAKASSKVGPHAGHDVCLGTHGGERPHAVGSSLPLFLWLPEPRSEESSMREPISHGMTWSWAPERRRT